MRVVLALAALVLSCSNDLPPQLGDYEGGPAISDDAHRPPTVVDAGAEAGTLEVLDFEGVCTPGERAIWHFFDFQTHTPGDASLVMSVLTADTEAGLGAAKAAPLATVTGQDITSWTGVDVDPVLAGIGEHSRLFLRVAIDAKPAADGTPPALVHYRQQYDCVVGQ